MHSPFILFFDCYIISSKLSIFQTYNSPDPSINAAIRPIRETQTAYRHRTKVEIAKYSLLSYRAISWSKIVIRFECEDSDDSKEFLKFLNEHFPDAFVVNNRSATAAQYVEALSDLLRFGNPWIFFCPNNDHPLLGDPKTFPRLLQLAEDCERLHTGSIVSILYSHFTESQTTTLPDQYGWYEHGGFLTNIIGETDIAQVIRTTKFCCDSIKIYRLNILLNIFGHSPNKGRCIRLEDTGFYLLDSISEVQINPNQELCRHYDSYTHVLPAIAPLFIPPGIWNSSIKIRFGYRDRKEDWVNVNPFEPYSYLGGAADLRCLLSELPHFWDSRISEIDINPDFASVYQDRLNEGFQFPILRNPWIETSDFTNYKRSAWKLAGYSHKHFNPTQCNLWWAAIKQNSPILETGKSGVISVYFVLSGRFLSSDRTYKKYDILMLRGEGQILIESLTTETEIVKVTLLGDGPPLITNMIW